MNINTSQRCGFPNQLSVAMDGSVDLVGTLLHNPVCITFKNQSADTVSLSVNDPTGANVWDTFVAGEVFTLDCRNQHGLAANFTMDIGTSFYASGTNGSGNFVIAYVYALGT